MITKGKCKKCKTPLMYVTVDRNNQSDSLTWFASFFNSANCSDDKFLPAWATRAVTS